MYSRALIIRDALILNLLGSVCFVCFFCLFSVHTGEALWCKTCQALNFVYATTVYHGMLCGHKYLGFFNLRWCSTRKFIHRDICTF